jgi:hypothetical protein
VKTLDGVSGLRSRSRVCWWVVVVDDCLSRPGRRWKPCIQPCHSRFALSKSLQILGSGGELGLEDFGMLIVDSLTRLELVRRYGVRLGKFLVSEAML